MNLVNLSSFSSSNPFNVMSSTDHSSQRTLMNYQKRQEYNSISQRGRFLQETNTAYSYNSRGNYRDGQSNPCDNGEHKVTICHIPPGNPENQRTITISCSALQTHQDEHGDYIGNCTTSEEEDDDEPDTAETETASVPINGSRFILLAGTLTLCFVIIQKQKLKNKKATS